MGRDWDRGVWTLPSSPPPLPCTSEHRNMITFLRLWFLFFNIHVINETHQHASNGFFPLYIGWFCEQPGFLTWWTGVGGRNWSGTQTRSVVANQRGQKRDKDHQVKEKRRLIKGKDSDFFGKTLSVKFSWILKKMKQTLYDWWKMYIWIHMYWLHRHWFSCIIFMCM